MLHAKQKFRLFVNKHQLQSSQILSQKLDKKAVDVRNHYEAAIGRFDGQMQVDDSTTKAAGGTDDGDEGRDDGGKKGGAEYIDPKMRKSTDFTSWLAEPETKKKLEGKTVMMFCTGEN